MTEKPTPEDFNLTEERRHVNRRAGFGGLISEPGFEFLHQENQKNRQLIEDLRGAVSGSLDDAKRSISSMLKWAIGITVTIFIFLGTGMLSFLDRYDTRHTQDFNSLRQEVRDLQERLRGVESTIYYKLEAGKDKKE